MKCQFCDSEDAYEVIDPYSFDLYDEEIEIVVCDDCYADRCDSI